MCKMYIYPERTQLGVRICKMHIYPERIRIAVRIYKPMRVLYYVLVHTYTPNILGAWTPKFGDRLGTKMNASLFENC